MGDSFFCAYSGDCMKTEWEFLTKSIFDPVVFWTMVTAVTTAALVVVGYVQLRQLVKTGQAEFLDRLKRDFLTPETQGLLFLVRYRLLEFEVNAPPRFHIRPLPEGSLKQRFQQLQIREETVSVFGIDELLLIPLDDLASFEKTGSVDLSGIYQLFGRYILDIVDNEAIHEYLVWVRAHHGGSFAFYSDLLVLFEKLKKLHTRHFPSH